MIGRLHEERCFSLKNRFLTQLKYKGSAISTWMIQQNSDILFWEHMIEVVHSKEHSMKDFMCEIILEFLVNKVTELMKAPGRMVDTYEDRSLSFLYPEEVLEITRKKPVSVVDSATMHVNFAFSNPAVSQLKDKKIARSTISVRRGETDNSGNPEKSNESELNLLLKVLYQVLLETSRQYVVGSQAVIFPEGVLALVPFSALLDENGHYAAESLQVRLIPSLATAKMIRERPEQPAGRGRPLVIGDPDIGTVKMDDKIITAPRLPFALKEVEMVVSKVLNVKPLVGKEATKKRFLRRVEHANLIHIASHGHAKRGEILFAPCSGKDINNVDDVMLKISDLESKRIKAKLVVLSCPYSGRGEVRTEGVIGIARAFLGAGARAVLVTLWEVDDKATLLFMLHFYKNLSYGKSANESLNIAGNAVREDEMFRHPRFWAPFTLIGEDVTIFDGSK